MSNEDEQQPQPHPFMQLFAPPAPPSPADVLASKKRLADFAKAALPQLKEMQRTAREVYVLYVDAPVNIGDLARRHHDVRDNLALMIEQLEGYARL